MSSRPGGSPRRGRFPRAVEGDERILARVARRRYRERKRQRGWLMRRLLLAADVFGYTVAAVGVELIINSGGNLDAMALIEELALLALGLPAFVIGAKLFGLYDRDEEQADTSTTDDLVRVFLLFTVGAFLMTRAPVVLGIAEPEPMKFTGLWAVGIVAVTGGRVVARALGRRSSAYRQNTVIVGAGEVGQLMARKLLQHREYGLNLIGFVDARPRKRLAHVEHLPVLGDVESLSAIVESLNIERVIFAFSNDPHGDLLQLVRRLRESGIQVDLVPRLFEVIGPKVGIHTVEGVSLVGLPPVRPSRSTRLLKRSMDIVGASLLLLVAAPFAVVAALLIKRDSPGPVLFRQRRLGEGMREFNVLKFRTMKVDTDSEAHRAYIATIMDSVATPGSGGLFKLSSSDAVTTTGRWLRSLSLDELPQLINVLRGDMSLVGPRPCLPYEVEHFAPHHFDRFLVPAGLTGLWQVSARARSTWVEALDMDVLYAQSQSLGLDLRLLLRTPLQLLRSRATA